MLDKWPTLEREWHEWASFANFLECIRFIRRLALFALKVFDFEKPSYQPSQGFGF